MAHLILQVYQCGDCGGDLEGWYCQEDCLYIASVRCLTCEGVGFYPCPIHTNLYEEPS